MTINFPDRIKRRIRASERAERRGIGPGTAGSADGFPAR
jgi:hypothetical protein